MAESLTWRRREFRTPRGFRTLSRRWRASYRHSLAARTEAEPVTSAEIHAGRWLADRTPRPPAQLVDRLAAVVGDARVVDHAALAELFIERATSLLRNVRDDRSGATDLLVADALITYAMEAAAADHSRFDDIAHRAMLAVAESLPRSEGV